MEKTKIKRQYYMDNVRTLIILSLFLVHACEIYHIGDGFYIEGIKRLLPTMTYTFFETFIMSVLFFFAGESTVYSLKARGVKAFYGNRCKKLLLPLLLGSYTFLPLQAWFVLKNHGDFDGSFLDAARYFCTHYNDFIGYDGTFGVAHLWFLLYLFVITILSFPVIACYDRFKEHFERLSFKSWWILALIAAVFILNYGPSDEQIGRFLLYYLLGIMLAENQSFSRYLEQKGKILFAIGLVFNVAALFLILRIKEGNIFTFSYFWRRLVWTTASVLMTLATMAMGKIYLKDSNSVSRHFSEISFLLYYFHLPILCVIGYFVLKMPLHYALQILLMVFLSFTSTLLLSETVHFLIKRWKRWRSR